MAAQARSGRPAATVSSVEVGGASVAAEVSCSSGSNACTLNLSLTAVEKLRDNRILAVAAGGRRRKLRIRMVVLAARTATVTAGSSQGIILTLGRHGIRLLASRHRFKAKLTISLAGHVITTRTLQFRAPTARRP